MFLCTYQPSERIATDRYDFIEKFLGYSPVWCFSAETEEEFLFKSWLAAPHFPQELYFIDTENYVKIDFIKWRDILNIQLKKERYYLTEKELEDCFSNVEDKYAEYIISEEELGKAINKICVRDFVFNRNIVDDDYYPLLQDAAEKAVRSMLNEAKNLDDALTTHGEDATAAIAAKTAMQFYTGQYAYRIGTRQDICKYYDWIPLAPAEDDFYLQDQWNELEGKLIESDDIDKKFTYDDYDTIIKMFSEVIDMRSRKTAKMLNIGRNDPCFCGSGMKYKKCHGSGNLLEK